MYDVNNHYYLIVLLQMETENVSDRSNNIFCLHWTAKCDESLRKRPKSDPIRRYVSFFVC